MITRLMRFALWIGHSGTSAVIAAQFGLAMMPLCSLTRRPLISGITSGTPSAMRKADELSTTTAPALTAIGANFLEMPPPAENSAMSTPANDVSVSSSMTMFWPRKVERLAGGPAARQRLELADREFPLVHGRHEFGADGAGDTDNGHSGIALHVHLHQAIKKPRSFSGGASVKRFVSRDLDARAYLRPEGRFFGGALGGLGHRRGTYGRRHAPSMLYRRDQAG